VSKANSSTARNDDAVIPFWDTRTTSGRAAEEGRPNGEHRARDCLDL